jgi:hypothetical protein
MSFFVEQEGFSPGRIVAKFPVFRRWVSEGAAPLENDEGIVLLETNRETPLSYEDWSILRDALDDLFEALHGPDHGPLMINEVDDLGELEIFFD